MAKTPACPYWQDLVDAISRAYERANGVPCPWGNKLAFRRLRELLDGNPKWSREMWLACVRNSFASDDRNLAAPPELLIPKLPCYVHGPLNKFHELKHATGAAEGMRRDDAYTPVELTPEDWAEIERLERKFGGRK